MKSKHRYVMNSNLRLRSYSVIMDAVSHAIDNGVKIAYKHIDNPTKCQIAECAELYVVNALCELIDFGDEE